MLPKKQLLWKMWCLADQCSAKSKNLQTGINWKQMSSFLDLQHIQAWHLFSQKSHGRTGGTGKCRPWISWMRLRVCASPHFCHGCALASVLPGFALFNFINVTNVFCLFLYFRQMQKLKETRPPLMLALPLQILHGTMNPWRSFLRQVEIKQLKKSTPYCQAFWDTILVIQI